VLLPHELFEPFHDHRIKGAYEGNVAAVVDLVPLNEKSDLLSLVPNNSIPLIFSLRKKAPNLGHGGFFACGFQKGEIEK
jgi:hypothetical protein